MAPKGLYKWPQKPPKLRQKAPKWAQMGPKCPSKTTPSPFKNQRSALQYVSKDGADAAVFQFNLWETLPGSTESRRKYRPVRLRGLDPEALYVLSGDMKETTASGETLMNTGLPWAPKGNIQSALIQIRKK